MSRKKIVNLGRQHRIVASTTVLILQDEYSLKNECCKKSLKHQYLKAAGQNVILRHLSTAVILVR